MRPSFSSCLVNDTFGDPGVYVDIAWARRALLFDLGQNLSLGPTRLLRAQDIFISHTHMDHFIGFDHLLRLFLARDRELNIYGPPGIIDNVRGKLGGYTWNLVDSYPFVLTVHEVGFERIEAVRLPACNAFRPEPPSSRPFDGVVHETPAYAVRAAHLDHRIPCLGYALCEKTRLNVRPERLEELGIPAGRWLNELKAAVREDLPDDTPIRAEWRDGTERKEATLRLGELRDKLLVETRGQKLAYVVDTIFTRANMQRITELVGGADVFFCESLFLDADRDQATKRYHLTARQAGTLARAAGVARLETFHFSPRYDRDPDPLRAEAQAAFRGDLSADEPE